MNDCSNNNNMLKSLNLIIKKNESKTGYKIVTPSANCKKRESSLSPSSSPSPSSSLNSIWSNTSETINDYERAMIAADSSSQPSSSPIDELPLITKETISSIKIDENNNNEIFCEFCNISNKNIEFNGRFCSKKCVIRFAQR